PFSDLAGEKRRPALILSNSKVPGDDLICCLMSSKFRKGDFEIFFKDLSQGNLELKSFVRPYRVFTINKNLIVKKVARVNFVFHQKIIKGLNSFLFSK